MAGKMAIFLHSSPRFAHLVIWGGGPIPCSIPCTGCECCSRSTFVAHNPLSSMLKHCPATAVNPSLVRSKAHRYASLPLPLVSSICLCAKHATYFDQNRSTSGGKGFLAPLHHRPYTQIVKQCVFQLFDFQPRSSLGRPFDLWAVLMRRPSRGGP